MVLNLPTPWGPGPRCDTGALYISTHLPHTGHVPARVWLFGRLRMFIVAMLAFLIFQHELCSISVLLFDDELIMWRNGAEGGSLR